MGELNFGKYAILEPVEHRFEADPSWYWMIKPITSGDELAMEKFLWQGRTNENVPVNREVVHREIAMTFGGTNIPKTKTENNELVPVLDANGDPIPILQKNAGLEDIEAVLLKMPNKMVMEIWEAVGNANPTWGPKKSGPKS